MPAGKIGKLTISRLISGGNLISGWAHSRDLNYVPSLMRAYNPDFYVKTLHGTNYWSNRRPDQGADVVDNPTDNHWDLDPQKTIAFMQQVEKPWIAFKTLAAGAIRPESGFKYAFENGADFICVGMFDFQVEANAALARSLVEKTRSRERDWMG